MYRLLMVVVVSMMLMVVVGCNNQPTQQPSNLISNADFEDGLDGWTLLNNLSIDHDHVISGQAAVKFSGIGTPNEYGNFESKLSQKISFTRGNILLSISGFGKGFEYQDLENGWGSGLYPHIYISMYNKNNVKLSTANLSWSQNRIESPGEQEYVYNYSTFVTPPGINYIIIEINCTSFKETFCNIDNLCLKVQ